MHSRKVVLQSHSAYQAERDDPLLQELIRDRVELFCAVGVDAEAWEDALDWLCIGPDGNGTHHVTTTAHPESTLSEVLKFAEAFAVSEPCSVQVIYVQ